MNPMCDLRDTWVLYRKVTIWTGTVVLWVWVAMAYILAMKRNQLMACGSFLAHA